MENEELNNSDYLAGSVIRQMLYNLKSEGERAIKKNKYNADYCDYVLIIYPVSNGKGGKWYYMGKDVLGTDSAIKQGLHGYDYDFDITQMDKLIADTPSGLLKEKLKGISNGTITYDFITCGLSYFKSEDYHKEVRKVLRDYMSKEYADFREIK